MPKATKDVKISLKPKPMVKESKAQEPKTKRDTKNSNKDKEPKGKRKTEKGPDAPKRSLSAYVLYCVDTRDKVREANPGAPINKIEEACPEEFTPEITRILERQWKELPDDAKIHEMAKSQWEIDKASHEKRIRPKLLSEDADEEDTGDKDFDV
ncbi:hypothetical protein BG000_006508 [Podila horticola]|nr:hypothetical protein BG000_006508 [Podila horticola]